jgi:hypothetical protein
LKSGYVTKLCHCTACQSLKQTFVTLDGRVQPPWSPISFYRFPALMSMSSSIQKWTPREFALEEFSAEEAL